MLCLFCLGLICSPQNKRTLVRVPSGASAERLAAIKTFFLECVKRMPGDEQSCACCLCVLKCVLFKKGGKMPKLK